MATQGLIIETPISHYASYAATIIPEIFAVKKFSSLVASTKIKTDENFTTANLISTLKFHGCLIPTSRLQNSSSLIVGVK